MVPTFVIAATARQGSIDNRLGVDSSQPDETDREQPRYQRKATTGGFKKNIEGYLSEAIEEEFFEQKYEES